MFLVGKILESCSEEINIRGDFRSGLVRRVQYDESDIVEFERVIEFDIKDSLPLTFRYGVVIAVCDSIRNISFGSCITQ